MEIAQKMMNPLATAYLGSEAPVPAGPEATEDLFAGKLFASLLAADGASGGLLAEGTEPETGALPPEPAVQPVPGTTVAGMLSCLWKTAAGNQHVLPEESKNARIPEQGKFSSVSLPATDPAVLVDEITASQESTSMKERMELHLKETENGLQLNVFLKEEKNSTPVEGETDDRRECAEQGYMAAVAVLQNIFGSVVPEANRGTPAPLETASVRIAVRGDGTLEKEKAALEYQPGIFKPGPANGMMEHADDTALEKTHDAGAGQILMERHAMPVQNGEVDDMRMTDEVKDLTSSPGASSPRRTLTDEAAGNRGELPVPREGKAVGGESDILSQGSIKTSTATMSSRVAGFSKAHGVGNEPDLQLSRRSAEEAKVMEGNGMETARVSVKAGDSEAAMTGNDFSRQENNGGNASREFSVKQDLAGNFEVLHTAAGDRTDAVSSPIDKGHLEENILRQVREKLVASLPEKDSGQVTLRLNPRELGDLRIDIRMENQKVAIDISAQNPVVKEALLQHLDTLKETLTRQNITMERFDVSTGTGHSADHSSRHERQPARHQPNENAFPFDGYYREETAQVRHADWLPREHALVDMRW